MLTIHYLGNEFLKKDSAAAMAARGIKGRFIGRVEFEKIDTFDKLTSFSEGQVFMDACDGLSKACVIDDIDEFVNFRRTSAHDMDFSFFLKLKKGLGEIEKVRVICVPMKKYKNLEEDLYGIIDKMVQDE